MAKEKEKSESIITGEGQNPAAGSVEPKPAADAEIWVGSVSFFDDSDLSPVELTSTAAFSIRPVGSQEWTSVKLEESEKGCRRFEVRLPRANTESFTAELRLDNEYVDGCTRYATTSLYLPLKLNGSEPTCCCAPFPLHRLGETCSIKFRAFDASKVDFIENAETFRASVEWSIRAVQTPAPTPAPKSATSTAPAAPPVPATKFQPWASTVRSVEGCAEIYDAPLHTLLQIETQAAEGYVCEGSSLQYRYICCENSVEITNYFKPCGARPVRSVVFVQQKCTGLRWEGTEVLLGGTRVPITADGIMKVPEDMYGVFPLSYSGKTFFPASLDLSKDAPPVSTVAVADQPVLATGQQVRGQFVDQTGKPFVRRPLSVLLPDGDEIQVTTDDNGFFEAPQRSQVYAREDEWGMATEPLLIV